jgi:hypothetical protein
VLIILLPDSIDHYTSALFSFCVGFLLIFAVVYNVLPDQYKKMSMVVNILSLGIFLIRAIKQFFRTLDNGLLMIVPGVVISFVLGTISDNLWQLINRIQWDELAIIISCLIAPILISGLYLKTINNKLQEFDYDVNLFSPELLYKTLIKRASRANAKKYSPAIFKQFQQSISWKWGERIVKTAQKELALELKEQAVLDYWFGIIISCILLFTFLCILFSAGFPQDMLNQWIGQKPVISLVFLWNELKLTHGFAFTSSFWSLVANDPVLKYSALSASILTCLLALDYAKDDKRLSIVLRLNKTNFLEWMILVCAYISHRELEYQKLGSIFIDMDQDGGFIRHQIAVPVILIPSKTAIANIGEVIPRLPKIVTDRGERYLVPCVFIMSAEDFLNSPSDIIYFRGDVDDISVNMMGNKGKISNCWVWIKNKNGRKEIMEFNDIDSARDWVLSKAGNIKFEKTNRE